MYLDLSYAYVHTRKSSKINIDNLAQLMQLWILCYSLCQFMYYTYVQSIYQVWFAVKWRNIGEIINNAPYLKACFITSCFSMSVMLFWVSNISCSASGHNGTHTWALHLRVELASIFNVFLDMLPWCIDLHCRTEYIYQVKTV